MKLFKFKTLLAVLVAGCALFITGCADNEYGIPKNLDGTTWIRSTGDSDRSTLSFSSDICTLQRKNTDGSNAATELYKFEYQAPNLKLNDKTSGALVWEGVMQSNDETYTILTMHNVNTEEYETYFLEGGDTYFQ